MAYIAIRRFLELVLPEMLLSVIFSVLFQLGVLPSYGWLVQLTVGVLLAAYILFHISMLRVAYTGIGDIPVYVGMNLIANGCFAVTNILLYTLLDRVAFTWVFGIFKAAHYLPADIGIGTSIVIVQLVMLLLIFAAPFGLVPPDCRAELGAPQSEPEDDIEKWLHAIEEA